jgi:hypothetical protein
MATLIAPSHKNIMFPQQKKRKKKTFYYHYGSMKVLHFSPIICNTIAHFWANNMGQTMVLLKNTLHAHSWVNLQCMLPQLIA